MIKVEPKEGILVVKKNDTSTSSSDMYIQEVDDDKRLITCTVISGNSKYSVGEVVVAGRYSMYQLSYLGEDYFFLDQEDVIATLEQNV